MSTAGSTIGGGDWCETEWGWEPGWSEVSPTKTHLGLGLGVEISGGVP